MILLGGSVTSLAGEPETYPAKGSQVFLGLDDTSAPTQVQDGRAADLQNVKLDISRSARQRFGYSLVGSTLDVILEDNCTVTGLYYTKLSSVEDRIVSTCGNRFYYLNGTAWTQVTGQTVTGVSVSAGQNNQFVWTTALDEIIGTNDVDAPLRFNGTTLNTVNFSTLSASQRISKAKTVSFFKNFLIFGNTVENSVDYPTRIRWSDVGTIGSFTDGNYIDIDALGGQEINGMGLLYDNLYVFLTDSIYRVSFVAGADTFQISKVTDDIGCVAKNSIQSITLNNSQNGLVFLDKDKKVYFFDGVAPHDITPLITNTMNGLSASRLSYAVSADTNTDYYLCATNGTAGTNNLCLDFQYQIGEWTKHTNIPANAMAHVLDNNSKDQVYFGSYEAFVYQLEDDDLSDDVGSASGRVSAVDVYTTTTASGLQVLYTSGAAFATGTLVGAPVEIIAGPGIGLTSTVAYNTGTGIVVTDAFSTTPTTNSYYEVGAIDSFYTTKWYDMGEAARLKHFGEVYFWADNDVSTITVTYATDLSADIETQEISLSTDAGDSLWGSATWGVSLWGSSSDVFRQVKLQAQGRYLRVKWTEDDPGQSFRIYGWVPVFWRGDVN